MQRYIRFARALNPRITPECQKVLVDCYRKLRQGDSMGRSRTAYRITVRQLESMIRLSEALARLHCSEVIQPSFVREAFRLLRKSIIHVETEDITFDNEEFDEEEGIENPGRLEAEQTEGDMTTANPVSPEKGENSANASIHPGEYAPGEEIDTPREAGTTRKRDSEEMPSDSAETLALPKKKAKKASKKKKTQISFEEYEAVSNAIATYLRSKEGEKEDEARPSSRETTWGDAVEWYLAQCEDQMGDSTEELERLRKLTNLVIRRLIRVDHVLIELGSASTGDEETDELNRIIAVHPNFAIN
jgi:DNA replication licensing factor MCM6